MGRADGGTGDHRAGRPPGRRASGGGGGAGGRAAGPAEVRARLSRPAGTRLIGPSYDASDDAAHHMSGGSPAHWFDAVVHVDEVTPARPLTD
ncbi:hypothetical protein [Streptomyces sp. NPDC014894]|uniref:hypothetical protein n=1 Tax=Streptomyces sp. NPDC014894 TaxID=3364931 RepID=UPI0036F66128